MKIKPQILKSGKIIIINIKIGKLKIKIIKEIKLII
jgi:hypothetical protein